MIECGLNSNSNLNSNRFSWLMQEIEKGRNPNQAQNPVSLAQPATLFFLLTRPAHFSLYPASPASVPALAQRHPPHGPYTSRSRSARVARAPPPLTDSADPHVRVISFPEPSSPVPRSPRFLAARGPAPPVRAPEAHWPASQSPSSF